MVAARLGCQACMLLCSLQIVSARGKMPAPHSWPAVIAGDIMASVLQLGHLPIGFQVCYLPRAWTSGILRPVGLHFTLLC